MSQTAGREGALEGPIALGSWGVIQEIDASRALTRLRPSRVALIGDRSWAGAPEARSLFESFWADPESAWGGDGESAPSWMALIGSMDAAREGWAEAFEGLKRRPRWPKLGVDEDEGVTEVARRPWLLLSAFELSAQSALLIIHQSPAIEKAFKLRKTQAGLAISRAGRLYRSAQGVGKPLSLDRQLGILALIAIKAQGRESPLEQLPQARDFALFHSAFGCDLEMLSVRMWDSFTNGVGAQSVLARCAAMGESWSLKEALGGEALEVSPARAAAKKRGRL